MHVYALAYWNGTASASASIVELADRLPKQNSSPPLAVRRADPHHLVMGAKFGSVAPHEVRRRGRLCCL